MHHEQLLELILGLTGIRGEIYGVSRCLEGNLSMGLGDIGECLDAHIANLLNDYQSQQQQLRSPPNVDLSLNDNRPLTPEDRIWTQLL